MAKARIADRAGEQADLFGPQLRALRADRGLTQGQLAELIGRPQSRVCEAELGTVRPSWEMVVACCYALDVTPDAFLARPRKEARS